MSHVRRIPSYELYGDLLAGSLSDPIHHETIKERSSRHDWTIRLHRHRRLSQIFLFHSAGVFFRLGDVEHTSTEPLILLVPPEVPHGFLFADDVVGDVLSLRMEEMPKGIQGQFGKLSAEIDMIFPASETRRFDNTAALVAQLGETYRSVSSNRAEVMTAQVNLMILYLLGDLSQKNAPGLAKITGPKDRQHVHVEKFCTLLEEHFHTPWAVVDYANRLGVSAPHLTRMCRLVLGSPPNNLVGQRRLLEARRLLEYTGLSVTEIAGRCGFRDAAFFSRTFKRKIGDTPQAYRRRLAPRSYTT